MQCHWEETHSVWNCGWKQPKQLTAQNRSGTNVCYWHFETHSEAYTTKQVRSNKVLYFTMVFVLFPYGPDLFSILCWLYQSLCLYTHRFWAELITVMRFWLIWLPSSCWQKTLNRRAVSDAAHSYFNNTVCLSSSPNCYLHLMFMHRESAHPYVLFVLKEKQKLAVNVETISGTNRLLHSWKVRICEMFKWLMKHCLEAKLWLYGTLNKIIYSGYGK